MFTPFIQRTIAVLLGAAACLASAPAVMAAAPADVASKIIQDTNISGGLVVHLGCGDGKLTAALRQNDRFVVQGLDADAKNVAAARSTVQSAGLYGAVAIDQFAGRQLPFIENMVNLLVVEDAAGVSKEEMLRVLAPRGVACIKSDDSWTRLEKPQPAEIDQWTHYLHDPSNNAVAHDSLVGPPRHLQWTCGPLWSRHHDHMASLSAMVSANGRVFYIMDEGPRDSILLPGKWMLIARDAYSGTLLWKREIPQWNTQLWPLKSGPNQLPRRLVAIDQRVYVTLGIDAPLTALDAATGKTLITYPGTDETDEILADGDTLYALVASAPNKWKDYRPNNTYVWGNSTRANKEWAWDEQPRAIMAIRATDGNVLWKHQSCVAPLTLALAGDAVYFFDGNKVVSLDRAGGKQRWVSDHGVERKQAFPTGYGPTLVVHQNVVLLSVQNKEMTAFSAANGKQLWQAPHHHGGHASPDDMLVIGGLVWSGAVGSPSDSGIFTGRDIQTGQVKHEFKPDVQADWFHHRCYRARATDKYFMASRTGIEYIDLAAEHWDINHWVRGGCLYGFMPSNGLTYVPPQSCGCFLESKLFGFNALAAESTSRAIPHDVPDEGRLEQGSAYAASAAQTAPQNAEDWPTYRHDGSRSAAAKTQISGDLSLAWQSQLGGKLSAVTVADGRLFVAAIDTHTLYCIDAQSGATLWTHTTGGRIDSPPTIFNQCAYFGSADGYVYCLRAEDGALAWRFRAAPVDRRIMAAEQIESAWPVSGSVLIENGVVYCVAGRSAFLDGGLRLLRLDAKSGKRLSETVIDDRVPGTNDNLQTLMKGQDLPVALPDILSTDGKSVYMRAQAFDMEGKRRHLGPVKLANPNRRRANETANTGDDAGIGDHIFSRSGFLDDSWFWRSYWVYGKAIDGNYGGWLLPGHFQPCGRLMAMDDKNLYSFDRKPEYLCNASVQDYYIYCADREVSPDAIKRVQEATGRINAASINKSASSSDWATRKKFSLTEQTPDNYHWAVSASQIQARALALAGDTLFIAGPPHLVDEEAAFKNPDDPAIKAALEAQVAALQGKNGSRLLALSAKDGKPAGTWNLQILPTFDGLAAARGKLYLSTADGKVICLGAGSGPLPQVAGPALSPLDISVKATTQPAPAGPAAGKNLNKDFARVINAIVTESALGYRVAMDKGDALVLKQLPQPLTGKFTLSARMQTTNLGKLRNGFIVFGDAPEKSAMIMCGLRVAMKKIMIVHGPLGSGKTVSEPFETNMEGVHDVLITVDLTAATVTMKFGKGTVTAKIDNCPRKITWLGYGGTNATNDFSPIEVKPK